MELRLVKFTVLLFSVLVAMCQLQGKFVVSLGMHHVKAVQSAQNISLAHLRAKSIFQDLIHLLLQELTLNTEKRPKKF